MQPSWTFPIPQAMQQHRGSQLQRTASPPIADLAANAESAIPQKCRDATEPAAGEPETQPQA
jgi:hypothetical protein